MQINQAVPASAGAVQGHRHHGGAQGLKSGLLDAVGAFSSGTSSGVQGTPALPTSAGSAGQATSTGSIASTDTFAALLSTQEQGSSQGQGSLATNMASLDKLLSATTKSGSAATAPVVSAVA